MMRPIILIFIITAACILRVSAQEDSVARQLLAFEQKIFLAASESERNSVLVDKVTFRIQRGQSGKATLNDIKRVKHDQLNDTVRKLNFLWNAALVSHINQDMNNARYYFEEYMIEKKDTSVTDALLGALIYDAIDTNAVRRFALAGARTDAGLSCISCLNEAAQYRKKGKGIIVFSSYLIPGSGSMMLGHVLKGAVSLVLVSSVGAGVYFLIADQLYINATVFAAPWFTKFYGGQIRLTKKLFSEKERKKKNRIATQCAEKLDTVLKMYPVEFRW